MLSQRTDLYEMLEIPEFSSINTIKQAYHKLAKKYHPDINPKTGHLFAEITDIYKLLSNPKSKAQYDTFLQNHNQQQDINEQIKKATESVNKSTAAMNDYIKKRQTTQKENKPKQSKPNTNSSYYTSSYYYTDPKNEPIFTILQHFFEYKPERATSSIWDRNIFVIIFATLILITMSPICLFVHMKDSNKLPTNTPITGLNALFHFINSYNIIIQVVTIIVLIFVILSKFITNIFKGWYWLFKNIFRYYLIPNAIRSRKH